MISALQDRLARRLDARKDGDTTTPRSLREAGFTLVELLVVITILGILAAIVVFSVAGISDKGQDAACKTDKSTIQSAEEANYAVNGSYVDGATLVTNGFLSAASTYYNVTATPDNPATTDVNENKYATAPIDTTKCAS